MKLLKQIKWNLIAIAVAFIALGVVLIIFPAEVMKTACYIMAALLIIIGVISLVNYLRKDIVGIIYRYDYKDKRFNYAHSGRSWFSCNN